MMLIIHLIYVLLVMCQSTGELTALVLPLHVGKSDSFISLIRYNKSNLAHTVFMPACVVWGFVLFVMGCPSRGECAL